MSSRKDDVLNRLTDPSKYTGAHKERFDSSGRGRGKDGRDMGNEQKVADLSQITRPNLKASASPRNAAAQKVDISDIQKFGTQASVARKIMVFCNGDQHHTGVKVTITKAINSWDKMLKKCSDTLKLPTGACLKVFHVVRGADGKLAHKRVTKVESLADGELYIGCGAEKIDHTRYPQALRDMME